MSHVARPQSMADIGSSTPVKTIQLRVPIDNGKRRGGHRDKLGLSIRGGAEHGMGIYVSSVDAGSIAEKQELTPGDQIRSVNGVSFADINQEEAAKVIIELLKDRDMFRIAYHSLFSFFIISNIMSALTRLC